MRRLAGRVAEGVMASGGAAAEVVGFLLLVLASQLASVPLLILGLTVIVGGFAFVTPSLNSLLSRRSDPQKQGGIMGVGQSVNAVARILGSAMGIPLLTIHHTLPLFLAAGLMAMGALLILWVSRSGHDFRQQAVVESV